MGKPKKIKTREELFMKLLTEYEESEENEVLDHLRNQRKKHKKRLDILSFL